MPEASTDPKKQEPRQGNLIIPPTMIASSKPAPGKQTESKPPKRVGWTGYALLILATLLAFSPILGSDFLWTEYDEVERTVFRSMNNWTEAWSVDFIRQHDPITATTYFLESLSPLPAASTHRLINILLHLAAALLLLKVLESLKLRGAFASALVFAVHPAAIQTLFWPGYRNELTGLVFILACLYFGTRSRGLVDFILALVTGLIGGLIHPAAYTLPALLALVIYFQNKRFHLHHYNKILPLSCGLLFVFVWTESAPAANPRPEELNLLTQAGQNVYFYLKQSLLPLDLQLFHPFPIGQRYNVGALNSLLAFLLFMPFYVLAAFNFRKRWARGLVLGLSGFLLLLSYGVFHSGQFIDGSLAKEEHAFYVALPAVIALTFCCAAGFFQRKATFGRYLWPAFYSCFFLVHIGLAASYSYSLRDPAQMWKTISEQWKDSWQPKAALANMVLSSGSDLIGTNEMIRTLEAILEANPGLHQERIHLARYYRDAGQNTNALREYRRILRETEPDNEFLEEAAQLFDKVGLTWEGNNTRERKKKPETQTPTNEPTLNDE